MTLKIALFRPMPSARVMTATAVNAGRFSKLRTLYRMSLSRVSMVLFPIADCRLPIRVKSKSLVISRLQNRKLLTIAKRQSAIGTRQSAMTSFVPERDQRIDFRRASSRNVTSEKSDQEQANAYHCKRRRVSG